MINLDQWRPGVILVVFLGVVAAVLHAGLRPYDFFVPNQVSWSEGTPGLRFTRQGIAATSESLEWFASGRAEPVSIEVWLRRGASPPADGGVVLALGDGERVAPLLLAQWQSSFYFRFPARDEGVLIEETLRLKDESPEEKRRFVAFTSGPEGSRAYVEAVEVASSVLSHFLGPGVRSLGGRLVLGSRLQACRGWDGMVDGLALYRRALSLEEVASHAAVVGNGDVKALAGERGLLALYAFDEGFGQRVRDLAGGAGDLSIPELYRPLDLGLLRFRPMAAGRPVTLDDAIVNVLGFIPVGLSALWALRRWTSLGGTSLFLIVTSIGFLLSLAIETTQAFLPSRVSAAGDLALNGLGSALGAALALAVSHKMLARWFGARR